MADADKILIECIVCGRAQQHGNHEYNVPHVPAWGAGVCLSCRRANWDGIVPGTHPVLMAHFKAHGIKVKLNAKGWIDIPS